MKNILITGGHGCIATETKKALLKDDSVSSVILTSRKERKNDNEDPKIKCVQANLNKLEDLKRIFEQFSITHIFHTAAIRTSEAETKPHEAFTANVQVTTNLLEAARRYKNLKRFVFISTAAVYGDIQHKVDESASTTAHFTYISSKLAAEQICECYAKNYGLQVVVIRPQILYGPSRLAEGSTASVSRAMISAAKGINDTIEFSGPHSFHFTEDVGSLFSKAILQNNQKIYEVYNLPGISFNCQELAVILERENKVSIEVKDKRLPFPTKINANKFLSDYPNCKIHSLEESVFKCNDIIQANKD